jgi:hypothetical protein
MKKYLVSVLLIIVLKFVSAQENSASNLQLTKNKESSQNYCRKAVWGLTASSITAALSATQFVIGSKVKNNPDAFPKYQNAGINSKILFATGATSAAASITGFILSGLKLSKCIRNKKLSAQVGINNISLAYKFSAIHPVPHSTPSHR